MAFTCFDCHTRPLKGWCAAAFHLDRADSFGRCENCGQSKGCMNCRCATVPMALHHDGPGVEPVKVRIDRHTVRETGKRAAMARFLMGEESAGRTVRVEAPDWLHCLVCGKTGSHTHGPGGRKVLDEVIDEVLADGRTVDPEHEPDNPYCLCFAEACRNRTPERCPRCRHVLKSRVPGGESCEFITTHPCYCACWNVLAGRGPVDVRAI